VNEPRLLGDSGKSTTAKMLLGGGDSTELLEQVALALSRELLAAIPSTALRGAL
jgi:hypothetical protein